MLQRLTQLDGEEVIVHQAADGLAGEQVGGKGLEQGVGERMTMDNAAGLTLFIQDCQRVQVGLAAKGFEHRGGRRVAVHRGQLVEQGAEVAAVFAQCNGGAVLSGHQCPGIPWRVFLGAAEQIALHQVHAHFGQHHEFFGELDTFGDDLRPRGLGDLQDRADELALERILMNAINEMPVDFHVIWP
ncbi:hypothetical protein D9M71_615960 [compost metagenome]